MELKISGDDVTEFIKVGLVVEKPKSILKHMDANVLDENTKVALRGFVDKDGKLD